MLEEIKKKIPKEIDVEIDISEYFPENKPFISQDLIAGEEENMIESMKEDLEEQKFKREDIDKAFEEADIKTNVYIILPNGDRVKVVWKSTDAWRGYYTLDIPDIDDKDVSKKVERTDKPIKMSLHYVSRDPSENERFLETAIGELKKSGFDAFPMLFGTSNVFSINADLIVAPSKEEAVWNRVKVDFIKEFEDVYVREYTGSFSIFEGTTKSIDPYIRNLVRKIDSIRKRKLEEVI